MNQVSHFLDGSTIYGSTLKKSRELRSFEGGKLLVKVKNNTEYLPSADEDSDIDCPSKDNCYDAGKLSFFFSNEVDGILFKCSDFDLVGFMQVTYVSTRNLNWP